MERKGMYVGIFVITTIVASCLAVYFCINGNTSKKKLEDKIDELNSQIVSIKNSYEGKQDTTQNEYKRPVLDNSKCLNPHKDSIDYRVFRTAGEINNTGVSCSIGSDKKVNLTINWDNLKKLRFKCI